MRTACWKDYELLDCSCGERLERWGDVILIRPDPQIIWETEKKHPLWKQAHARYLRSQTGGGKWQVYKNHPDVWEIGCHSLRFRIKPMGFKHTGVFPEQAVNWDFVSDKIKQSARQLNVLNLFAYTAARRLPVWKRARRYAMWTPQRVWYSGQRKTRRCPGFPNALSDGLWTTASNLCRRSSAAATGTTGLSWTHLLTAGARAARSGSSKNSFIRS